jgi:hypothetical protein
LGRDALRNAAAARIAVWHESRPQAAVGRQAGGPCGPACIHKAKGLGLSTVGAQFFGGADAAGNKTKSDGYLLQATYKLGDTKFGLNHGQNKDKGGLLGSGNEQKNRSCTLGVYDSLNKFITLTGEYNNEKKPGALFGGAKNNTVPPGAIMFF